MSPRGFLAICLLAISLSAKPCLAGQEQPRPPAKAEERILVLDGLGKGTAELDGLWQFKTGDDPSWASPSFDDSKWEPMLVDTPWGSQGHPSYTGFGWYRRHIRIVGTTGANNQYQLLIPDTEDAYEVFWNGNLVGTYGKMPPHGRWYYTATAQSFPLTGTTSGVLAVRVWKAPLDIFSMAESGGFYAVPKVGDPDTIDLYKRALTWHFIQLELFEYSLLLLRVSVALLCVFLWSKNRREQLFIWLGAYTAAPVALRILGGMFLIPISYSLARFINQPVYVLSNVSLWFLLVVLLKLTTHRRLVRLTRVMAWLMFAAGIADGVLAYFWAGATPAMQWADGILTALILLAEVYPFLLIVIGLRQKLDSSRLAVALTAFILQMLHTIEDTSALGQRFTHWTLFTALVDAPLFTIQGIDFQFEKITSLALFAAILFAVYRYIGEQQARRTALEQEIQSAREIQQVLIPETLPSLEGYGVTSAYTPAQEVGGDFFQILPTANGSTIVAIGDVSGKGLKAAMNVAMIVGVTRAQAATTSSPAEILTALNLCMVGRMRGGFATGIVFRLDPDGTVTMANAGHLPPYLNGKEFQLDPSLPLGLLSTVAYREDSLHLLPGDQLSIYTDGLLEARNATGELYGFERLSALFAKRPTAQEASEAAVAFGQDDDITILTLTRLEAGQESTTMVMAPTLQAVADRD